MRAVVGGMVIAGLTLVVLAGCVAPSPTASVSPSSTVSVSPAPTAAASATPAASATTSPGPATPSPSRSHTPSPRPTVSATPAVVPTVVPTMSPAGPLGVDVRRLPTSKHVVALTFDAGGNADGVPKILATLASENVTGTFFLTGAWTRVYPAYAAAIAARYPVGNHTMTHPHFNELSDAAILAQITDARAFIRSVAHRDPFPLFRFPYGQRDAHDIALVNGLGYVPISWTVDTLGWQGTTGGRSADTVVARVLDQLQPGEIILMHVGSHPRDRSILDADALPGVISAIRAAGYEFVSVSDGLGLH